MTSSKNKTVSRDLLKLEGPPSLASPFLISPSQSAASAFPFPSPPATLAHVPLPFPSSALAADFAAASPSAAATPAAASSSSSAAPNRLKTFAMPPSSLLSRVQAFLPELAKANAKLHEEIAVSGPEAVDIENCDDGEDGGESQHIVMDLSVGVLELQKDDPELNEAAIIIPGVTDPMTLRGAAAAAGASDSDDEEESKSSSTSSKAARKKRKYRVRNKAKKEAAAAAADANDEPLPSPAKGSLIQLMEE